MISPGKGHMSTRGKIVGKKIILVLVANKMAVSNAGVLHWMTDLSEIRLTTHLRLGVPNVCNVQMDVNTASKKMFLS